MKLTVDNVEDILSRVPTLVQMEEYWSCEWLQGFITQLEMDAEVDIRPLTSPFAAKVKKCMDVWVVIPVHQQKLMQSVCVGNLTPNMIDILPLCLCCPG